MPIVYRNQQIITVSESSKKELLKMWMINSSNIEVINPGVEIDFFSRSAKTVYPSFLYLGRLKKYKNIDLAILAFSNLVEKIPDAKMVIAGSGESLDFLQKLVQRLNLQNNVIFGGKVSEDEKARLFSSSWACIQPSSIEGWGITVIEANASGTPVIAADVNGLRDSVVNKQTGILVKPRSVKALTAAMEEIVLNYQYRKTLSEQAFEWAKNFSWEKSSEKFHDLIEKTIWKGTPQVIPGLALEKGI